MVYLKKYGGHGFLSHVHCGREDAQLDKASRDLSHSQAYLGKNIFLGHQFSWQVQVLPTKWSLPQVFNIFCTEYGHPHVDLFATRANIKLPL